MGADELQAHATMPLRGTGHSKLVGDDTPYFESLSELDAWAVTPSKRLNGVLRYSERSSGLGSKHSGKLLVNRCLAILKLPS